MPNKSMVIHRARTVEWSDVGEDGCDWWLVPEVDNYTPSPDTTRVTGTISDKQIDRLDSAGIDELIKKAQAHVRKLEAEKGN